MTGSLTVVQAATLPASSKSRRTATDPVRLQLPGPTAGEIVSSALAVCPVLLHATTSNAGAGDHDGVSPTTR